MFEDELNLREYWHVIRKRRWVVITLTCIIAVSVMILTFQQTPIYQATARILIEKEAPNILSFKEVLDLDTSNTDYYQTQYKILTSRTLARKALERLGLLDQNSRQAEEEAQFSLGTAITWVQQQLGLQEELVLTAEEEDVQREEHMITGFLRSITISPIRDSRLVDVSARSADRKQTALFANTLVDVYIEQNLDNKLSTTKDAVTWLSKELELTQQKLVESEAALHAYKQEHEIISIEDRQNIVMQKLSELNTAVNEAKIHRAALESEYKKIQQYGVTQLDTIPAVMNNQFIQELKAELSVLETKSSELQEKFRSKHPSVEAVRTQIVAVRKRINTEVSRVIESLKSEYDIAHQKEIDLMAMLEEQKQEALDLNQKSIKYKELQREVDSNQRIYDTLLQRAKEASISERLESSNIQIVDQATVPVVPVAPNKQRNVVMGVLLGLAVGIAMAFFFEYLDNTIKSGEDIKQYLDVPFLGLVPKASEKDLTDQNTRYSADIIVALKPKSNVAEAYRSLRTNVTFAMMNNPYLAANHGEVLLVTSSNPSEGKSCIVANLGIAMAQSGSKTLIIDCDFRRPVMHKIFDLQDAEAGFADMLTNVKVYGRKKGIKQTQIDNLHVIPCGKVPHNPSELLSSALARMLIGTLAEKYDKVLIDSPPINTVTDPVILSRLVNGVVFVVRAGETKRDVALRAMEQLRSAEAPIVGGVLNSVDFQKDRYYYYSYYYYHSHYYNSQSQENPKPKPLQVVPPSQRKAAG